MHFVIKLEKKNRKDFWCVLVELKRYNCYLFLKSFDRIADAVNFIHTLQNQIEEGDFSCLNLKT